MSEKLGREKLAIKGGKPAKTTPNPPMFPGGLEIGQEEKKAVLEVLDRKYLFRYYGPEEFSSRVKLLEEEFAKRYCQKFYEKRGEKNGKRWINTI